MNVIIAKYMWMLIIITNNVDGIPVIVSTLNCVRYSLEVSTCLLNIYLSIHRHSYMLVYAQNG